MKETLRYVAAFACGAAIGVTAGILLAPAKGSTTRKKIGRTVHHISDSVQDKIEDIKDSISDLIEDVVSTK
jgi:gas vesicle protein